MARERKDAMGALSKTLESVRLESVRMWSGLQSRAVSLARSQSGQGTTEYAILVGVLVVIAILAITVFRPRLQELWNAISDGINSL